ncbi:ferredoxin--NADP reductase [soil metagenome]
MAIIKNINIELEVKYTQQIAIGNMNVYFYWPKNFTFQSGDWIDLSVQGKQLKGGITYSLSSSPTESELMISIKIGISEFKQHLQSLQPGNKLYITQYGNDYNFYLKDNRTSVCIAGGIGIAPFRSMLKEMIDTNNRNEVQLIYFNKDEAFLFQEEVDEWRKVLKLDVQYIQTDMLKRKDRVKVFKETMRKDGDLYFIAGPEGMVESTEHILLDLGINLKNIRVDSFGGY